MNRLSITTTAIAIACVVAIWFWLTMPARCSHDWYVDQVEISGQNRTETSHCNKCGATHIVETVYIEEVTK